MSTPPMLPRQHGHRSGCPLAAACEAARSTHDRQYNIWQHGKINASLRLVKHI